MKRIRFETPGEVRFITFSCWQRLPILLSDWSKDIIVEQLAQEQRVHKLEIFAFCVMPNHVHLLLRPDPETTQLNRVLSNIKSRSARKILTQLQNSSQQPSQAEITAVKERKVWQEGGGYDRNIFSAREFMEKAGYIDSNPVKALLCVKPEEYRWCSAGTSLIQRAPW